MTPFYPRGTPIGGYGQAAFLRAAYSADIGGFDAFWESVKGGAIASYGLGTAIRELSLPPRAPTVPERLATPLPDTTGMTDQEQRDAVLDYILDPVQVEDPASLDARRAAAGAITEEQYKASSFYREGVPWDASMTMERAAALAAWNDAAVHRATVLANTDTFAVQTIGDIAGQALDPINYVPILGQGAKAIAVTRLGFLAGRAAVSGVDAMLNTAIAALATREIRRRFGDDVSWQATLLDIGTAGLIGGAFGTGAGLIERRARARFEVRAAADIHTVLNDAVGGLVTKGEVELSPSAAAPLSRIEIERRALGDAYDQVRAADAGPADDPLVHITPEEIEATTISRGGWKGRGDITVKKGGWGLVKFIWRHGEESGKPPQFQVSREDVLDFPRIIREYEPSALDNPANNTGREWRVEREDPQHGRRIVVYGESLHVLGPNRRGMVTIYVQQPDAPGKDSPLSQRRAGAGGSPSEGESPLGDTAGTGLVSRAPGPPTPAAGTIGGVSRGSNAPASRTLGAPAPEPPSPAIAEAAADVAGRAQAPAPDAARAAEDAGLDLESGDPVELAELEQLGAEGRLGAADQARFDEATAMVEQSDAYGEAMRSAATCLMG